MGESIPLKMEQELTALESIITQQEEPVSSEVEEELTAVESILCREGEFIRLSETCIRLELESETWLTLGNALPVDDFLEFRTFPRNCRYSIFVSFITSIPVVIKPMYRS